MTCDLQQVGPIKESELQVQVVVIVHYFRIYGSKPPRPMMVYIAINSEAMDYVCYIPQWNELLLVQDILLHSYLTWLFGYYPVCSDSSLVSLLYYYQTIYRIEDEIACSYDLYSLGMCEWKDCPGEYSRPHLPITASQPLPTLSTESLLSQTLPTLTTEPLLPQPLPTLY